LLAVSDPQTRLELSKRIARGGLTVRQVERIAVRGTPAKSVHPPIQLDANMKAAIEELQRAYGTRVLVTLSSEKRPGHLIFEYYNDSDLVRLYDILTSK
jgi:hypothetical protein